MRHLATTLAVWSALFAGADGAEPIIILIGGNHSDPSPAQLAGTAERGGNSGLWRLKDDLLSEEMLPAEYFNWNGTRGGKIDDPHPGGPHEIARVIGELHRQRSNAPIIVVGNSWGGHTAVQVCQLLNGQPVPVENGRQQSIDSSTPGQVDGETITRPPSSANGEVSGPCARSSTDPAGAPAATVDSGVLTVDLVVFLDPSSFGRGKDPKPTALPENVSLAVNYFTHNSFGWREWPDEPRMENVDLGDPQNGFLYADGPKYDSALNWQAHVSAEWDERIHADIRSRIRARNVVEINPESSPE